MFSRDTWVEIFQTISKNKLRTFLSGFTVALGIFIFVVLFGFGNGLKNQFKEFFWMMQQMCLQFFLVKRPSLLWDLNQIDKSGLRIVIFQV